MTEANDKLAGALQRETDLAQEARLQVKAAKEARAEADKERDAADKGRDAAKSETVKAQVREARVYAIQGNYGAALATALDALDVGSSRLDETTAYEATTALYNAMLNTREIFSIQNQSHPFKYASLTPNGQHIITISKDDKSSTDLFRIWSTDSGKLLQEYALNRISENYRVNFSNDGKMIIVCRQSNLIIFDIYNDTIKFRTILTGNFSFADVSNDNKLLITGGAFGDVYIYDSHTLALQYHFKIKNKSDQSLELNPIAFAGIKNGVVFAVTNFGQFRYTDLRNINYYINNANLKREEKCAETSWL